MTKLTTKEQYEWAVARVEVLLPLVNDDTPADCPERIELEILSNLVADYSEEHFDIGEPSLSDILKLRMQEMGLTQKAMAELLDVSPSRINDFFTGRAEPTLKTAKKIYHRLNIEPSIILS